MRGIHRRTTFVAKSNGWFEACSTLRAKRHDVTFGGWQRVRRLLSCKSLVENPCALVKQRKPLARPRCSVLRLATQVDSK